jgi:hypothetical protein
LKVLSFFTNPMIFSTTYSTTFMYLLCLVLSNWHTTLLKLSKSHTYRNMQSNRFKMFSFANNKNPSSKPKQNVNTNFALTIPLVLLMCFEISKQKRWDFKHWRYIGDKHFEHKKLEPYPHQTRLQQQINPYRIIFYVYKYLTFKPNTQQGRNKKLHS